MIKGCEKKIVYLKDTGSDYFEEAYFVVKPQKCTENDIIAEANKIVNGFMDEDKGKSKISKGKIFSFLGGLLLGALLSLGVCLIFTV